MPQLNEGSERKTDRLEAFSDAVLAIAITLPILDLKAPRVPHGGDLAAAYAKLWPEYGSYLLSFTVIGLYWARSHFSGKILQKTDHGFNLLTLIFLGLVSITPFPSRPFIEHFSDPLNNRAAATLYAALLTAPSLSWLVRWIYAEKFELLDPRLAPEYISKLTQHYTRTTGGLILGTVLTYFADFRLGMAVVALVTLGYMWPPLTPQWKPNQEPQDDLDEADEYPSPVEA